MSVNVETLVNVDLEQRFSDLSTMKPGSEEFKATADWTDKLLTHAEKIYAAEVDREDKAETRRLEERTRNQRLKHDRMTVLVEVGKAIIEIGVSTATTLILTKAVMKFEETGAFTSFIGKTIAQKKWFSKK